MIRLETVGVKFFFFLRCIQRIRLQNRKLTAGQETKQIQQSLESFQGNIPVVDSD